MEEKFEQLHQRVLELISAIQAAKAGKTELQQSFDDLEKTNRELEEKLSYQTKLIEALQL